MKNKNKMSATQKIKVEETESSIVSRSQGRPAHGDWYGFTKIKRNDRSIAKCNNCSKLVMNTSKARLECHRKKCITNPIEVQSDSGLSSVYIPALEEIHFEIDYVDSSPSNAASNVSFDLACAKYFYSCNIPFDCANNDYFKVFCRNLNSAYEPPTPQQLTGPLLDSVYEEMEKMNTAALHENSIVSLLIDGWKNERTNSKIVVLIADNCVERIFLHAVNISMEHETTEKLLEIVHEVIGLTKKKYNVTVAAVVSNNASAYVNMGRALIDENILFTTCNARAGNLLIKDYLNEFDEENCVMKNVDKIVNEFKKGDKELSLIAYGGKKANETCFSRWNSRINSLNWLICNLNEIRLVCEQQTRSDDELVAPEIAKLLNDDIFIENAQKISNALDLVAKLIDKCQCSNATLADAVEYWLELIETAPPELKSLAERRCEKSNVFNEYALTANLLHPKYRGRKFSLKQMTEAEIFLCKKLEEDELESFYDYKENKNIFALASQKTVNPKLFWKITKTSHSKFVAHAERFMIIPSSTGQLESLFANWACNHDNEKDLLQSEMSKKLFYNYISLRLNQNPDESKFDCE